MKKTTANVARAATISIKKINLGGGDILLHAYFILFLYAY